MLGLAVAATLGANIGYGLPYGWQGALISGWPAVAFIGCAEMAIGMVRRARSQPASSTEIPVPEVPATMNGHVEKAAELFAPDLARGEVPGVRRIRRELRIGQPKAQQVREYLTGLASGNGHAWSRTRELAPADATAHEKFTMMR